MVKLEFLFYVNRVRYLLRYNKEPISETKELNDRDHLARMLYSNIY